MTAKQMLDGLLTLVGYKQAWHVCWVAFSKDRTTSYGDGTYTVTPRLTSKAIKDLRAMLAADTAKSAGFEIKPEQISITGLTRIGR